MSSETRQKIVVAKTLHGKGTRVESIGYVSLDKPVLKQITSSGAGILVGECAVRVSHDNGRTWRHDGPWNKDIGRQAEFTLCRSEPRHYLDAERGVLVEFFNVCEEGPSGDYAGGFGPGQNGMPPQTRTGRVYYRVSRDNGKSWEPRKQIIQAHGDYDDVKWADGISYGKNSAYAMSPIRLRDGTIVLPICTTILGSDGEMIAWPDRFGTSIWPVESAACLVGRWRDDDGAIDWELSNHLTVPEYMSRSLTEPAVAELDDGTLMMVMRGSSGPRQTLPSVKFFSISSDGARTWGPVIPLTYPDCSYVYSPGSYLSFFRSSKNGRLYLIANILPGPTKHCDPRYPLKIVEIDRHYLWALPETETVIQDRERRHGKLIRFSNWRGYEDRETGNPVIYMTEARADTILPDPEEAPIVPDAYRYEIVLPGA